MLLLLLLCGMLNLAFLCYIADVLLSCLNQVSKSPTTHRAYLGQRVGKLLFKRPAVYRVILMTFRGQEEPDPPTMSEDKAMRAVRMYQEAPEVQRIAVYRNGNYYKGWVRPSLSIETPFPLGHTASSVAQHADIATRKNE